MFKFLQDLASKLRVKVIEQEQNFLAGDLSNYVERKADEDLLNFLKNTQVPVRLCYILAPPQTGKTWLMKKTASRLSQAGYQCFQFSLKLSATTFSESAFYLHLLTRICQDLSQEGMNLIEVLDQFWRQTEQKQPGERFQSFTREILKKLVSCQAIVFIDNVQKLREWKSHQSFLATIQHLFESGDESLQKLTFVLLGTDNPWDFFSNPRDASIATEIKLENFQGDCQPLLAGLKNFSRNTEKILPEILCQTEGQPFLTKFLYYLVRKGGRISPETNLRVYIEALVKKTLIEESPNQEQIKSHFQSVENYFLREPLKNIDRKLYALSLYGRVAKGESCEFSANSFAQKELLLSGLVVKSDNFLRVANPIYAQFFTQEWVKVVQQIIRRKKGYMPSNKIYNRKVYMLIDQSGSMVDPDPLFNNERRWKALPEAIKGHVYNIMEETGLDDEKICDHITVTLFSANSANPYSVDIYSDQDIRNVFNDNKPGTNTFIKPTLEKVIDNYLAVRNNYSGGFIIIYTDGLLSDQKPFETLVTSTCAKLGNQDELKIVIIGVGSDVERNPKPYLYLDANTSNNKDKNNKPCNIVVFDTLSRMPNIIDLLDCQLVNPQAGLVEWGREFCPELYN